jgi:hypothetical protein
MPREGEARPLRRARRRHRHLLGAGAFPLLLAAGWAGPAAASSASAAQLTGTFAMVIHGTAPKSVARSSYDVGWSFTPACDSGPCAVEVDTLASSCESGACPEPPSQFSLAGNELSLHHGRYQGTFSVKTGCTSNGTYLPYAYKQRTTLTLSPIAAAIVGSIGTTPVRHVSALAGTLSLKEISTGTRGCGTYTEKFSLRGRVQR